MSPTLIAPRLLRGSVVLASALVLAGPAVAGPAPAGAATASGASAPAGGAAKETIAKRYPPVRRPTHRRVVRHRRASASQDCANTDARADRASTQAMRAAVVCLLNRERKKRNLPSLREIRRLDSSAQGWTNVMVARAIFDHVAIGSDPGARISSAGFSWSSIGENIATGYPTPRTVVAAWMASTGHCQNILSPSFSYVGQGVSTRSVPGVSSGPATWTTDFGLPAGASPPSRNSGPADRCPY